MSIRLCCFANEAMSISQNRLVKSAVEVGGAEVIDAWNDTMLPDDFLDYFKEEFKEKQRYGWYCFKPYVVMRSMLECKDGDILIYCDAGNEIVGPFQKVIDCMDQDIMIFSNGWKHVEWCKADVYNSINPNMQYDDFRDYLMPQAQASTIFFKITNQSRKFIKEWYAWSLMPGLINNDPSVIPNVSTFAEHRWDQAILTCLQIKYGYRLHWFPSTTAGHLDKPKGDDYPAILWHHRLRDSEYKKS